MGIGTKSFIEKSEINACCVDCGKEEGVSSKRVSRVARQVFIEMQSARGIIGQRINKSANNVSPSHVMRRCSRTHRPRKAVPFASYQECH